MRSQTLALFFRALRVDARLLQSHLLRFGLLLFLVLHLVLEQNAAFGFGAPGLRFFEFLSFVNFGFATIAGPLLFATCITEEKEQQTLGLLRIANISPLSLLLGKLAPRLMSTLLIVSVQFPLTLLATTLGGVSWLQVHAMLWMLVSHTFLVAAVGLLCSVVCRRTSTAAGLTILLLGVLLVLPGIGYSYFSSTLPPAGAAGSPDWQVRAVVLAHQLGLAVSRAWFQCTAAWKLYDILTSGFGGSAFSLQVASNLLAGFVLLGTAWLAFDVFNRNVDVAAPSPAHTIENWLRRKGRSAPRAWRAAVMGREFRYGTGGYGAWTVKLLTYGPAAILTLWAVEGSFRRIDAGDVGRMLMVMSAYVVLPLESVLLASRVFRNEIRERTWSTLCLLPMAMPRVVYSKLAGTALALVPAVIYIVIGALLSPSDVRAFLNSLQQPGEWGVHLGFVVHLLLVLHLVAYFSILTNAWTGLLLALLTWALGSWILYALVYLPIVMGLVPFNVFVSGTVRAYLEFVYSVVAVVLLGIAGVLHWRIGRRLLRAAAE